MHGRSIRCAVRPITDWNVRSDSLAIVRVGKGHVGESSGPWFTDWNGNTDRLWEHFITFDRHLSVDFPFRF